MCCSTCTNLRPQRDHCSSAGIECLVLKDMCGKIHLYMGQHKGQLCCVLLQFEDDVYVATSEPHGDIEATITRGDIEPHCKL